MKRLFFAVLLMLAISAFLVFPAFAADDCADMPGMHDSTVASLMMHVEHANQMGHIKNELMPALMAPLNTAANTNLPTAARVGALNAFVNLVNAQAGKGIAADCAQHLVMQTQQVIAALQA